jgi:hypothetical protein
MEHNKPRLSEEQLVRLTNALARVIGSEFFDEFVSKFPEGEQDMADKVSDATLLANESFAFHVEELLDDVFDMIVDDICFENGWDLPDELYNELEEGKTL